MLSDCLLMIKIPLISTAVMSGPCSIPSVSIFLSGTFFAGDSFEFISEDSGWYEIQLTDGSTGFISEQYAELIEGEN